MEIEEDRKPILSKRVLIALTIIFFLVIAAIFVAISSIEIDISSDVSYNESALNETLSETEEEDSDGFETLFDMLGKIPLIVFIIIGLGIIAFKFFTRDRNEI